MSFPRYSKYKASGVEWLGDVPAGWEVKRSDTFLSYSREQLDPKDFQELEVFHYSIPVVQETGTGQLEDGAEIASAKQIIKKQVVLVSKLNPRKATICIAEPQKALTLCSTEFVALEPNGCDVRYLSYLVRTEGFRQGLESKVKSVTNSHQRANPADIYRFWNAWPVLPEQAAIAEFLDRETAKIDDLVAEQLRLMELLKEKRQAVISHAVTKGLNPHAPMKPSGIEWLGDVPEGWGVFALNRLVHSSRRITYGIVQPGERDEGGRFMVRGQDYSFGWAAPETLFKVSDAVEMPYRRARLITGDLVITIVGAGVGNVAVIPSWLDGANITQTTARISIDATKADPRFVSAVLKGPIGRRSVELYAKGAAQPGLNLEHLRIFPIPVPPLREQRAIADFIEAETSHFDALTVEAQRAIDFLHERRTALISAAVTGQIDVRQQSRN